MSQRGVRDMLLQMGVTNDKSTAVTMRDIANRFYNGDMSHNLATSIRLMIKGGDLEIFHQYTEAGQKVKMLINVRHFYFSDRYWKVLKGDLSTPIIQNIGRKA